MNYKELKELFKKIECEGNYKEVVKAFISYEKCIDDEKALNDIYERYMDTDISLFSDYMEDIIEGVEEDI